MPVVGLVRAPNVNEAIDCAVRVEHGYGHTAVMHSTNIVSLSRMARAVNTSIFVKKCPVQLGPVSMEKALRRGRLPVQRVKA